MAGNNLQNLDNLQDLDKNNINPDLLKNIKTFNPKSLKHVENDRKLSDASKSAAIKRTLSSNKHDEDTWQAVGSDESDEELFFGDCPGTEHTMDTSRPTCGTRYRSSTLTNERGAGTIISPDLEKEFERIQEENKKAEKYFYNEAQHFGLYMSGEYDKNTIKNYITSFVNDKITSALSYCRISSPNLVYKEDQNSPTRRLVDNFIKNINDILQQKGLEYRIDLNKAQAEYEVINTKMSLTGGGMLENKDPVLQK